MTRLRSRLPNLLILAVLLLTSFGAGNPAALAAPGSQTTPAVPSGQQPAPEAPFPPGAGILSIPFGQSAPKVDGFCSDYAGAITQTFTDGNGQPGKVYLLYNGTTLYVCMQAQAGSFPDRFGSLYLDPEGDGTNYVFAQKSDMAFHVGITTGARTSYRGSGVSNGYTLDPGLDPLWAGAASNSTDGESVEYALNLGRLMEGKNCTLFRIAVYHHWFSKVGDDYGWPSNQWFDQPRTWQLAWLNNPACTDRSGRIAYVFRGRTADAVSYFNLLTSAGYAVTLVPLSNVVATNFAQFTLIIVADDSGDLNRWGSPGLTNAQVTQIITPNRPIIGLGEGGYAFFGQLSLFIGWPNGWHGPQNVMNKAGTAPPAIFTNPFAIPDPVQHYLNPENSVGIYLGSLPAGVTPVGLENPTKDHASEILEGCRMLWGNSGNPWAMTLNGQHLFLNTVQYMNAFQCPNLPPPPDNCVTIVKTAVPAAGTSVQPGDIIKYTLTYTYSNDPACRNPKTATILDTVPFDTNFVPGSATAGISPGADGSLRWPISPVAGPQVLEFSTVVSENQCADQHMVNNRAGILVPGYSPLISNVVSHPVECPPVGFPNPEQPMFAENEITINPYPLINGHPSTIQVKVSNFTAADQTVTVAFQTSPNKFGIGLDFNTFDSKIVTIPAHGNAIVQGVFVPAASGHYCIQIVVTGPALNEPLVTQRNIDVTETLVAGQADTLTFKVRNNSSATANISLVVDNTCPGWSAAIIDPPGAVLTNMAPGEIRNATLQVTPPNPVTLGTTCHIDVQGWIGSTMIGGIRKLDVPPVHLPSGVNPPWEEPEISFNPDPPQVGKAGQICIELQNPLDVPRTVTLDYAVADFGAGIPFTLITSKVVVLPPHSNAKYCADWTPAGGGTLHRCVLVTLRQDGYQPQYSQHNVDLVKIRLVDISKIKIPFVVGNPDMVQHTLTISPTVFGVLPYWMPKIITDPGDPPPDVLMPGQQIMLNLVFAHPMATSGTDIVVQPPDYAYGDVSKVEVSVQLDGEQVGGFSVELSTSRLYVPYVHK